MTFDICFFLFWTLEYSHGSYYKTNILLYFYYKDGFSFRSLKSVLLFTPVPTYPICRHKFNVETIHGQHENPYREGKDKSFYNLLLSWKEHSYYPKLRNYVYFMNLYLQSIIISLISWFNPGFSPRYIKRLLYENYNFR